MTYEELREVNGLVARRRYIIDLVAVGKAPVGARLTIYELEQQLRALGVQPA